MSKKENYYILNWFYLISNFPNMELHSKFQIFIQLRHSVQFCLMKRDFISRIERPQMDPNSHLDDSQKKKKKKFSPGYLRK